MKKKVKLKIPKKRFLKNRRGELTTQQLVTIIILITSFAIILLLLWRLNLGEETNAEICHNSVVMKAQSKLVSGPLDCRTNYVCISQGGECADFTSTKVVEIKNKDEILKAFGDEMSNCWWMFGEGKINYGGSFKDTSIDCAICSIVRFDDKISSEIPEITYAEFYDFLSKNKKDETQTYLKYLYGINDVGLFQKEPLLNTEITGTILTSKQYSVLTGVDNNLNPFDDVILKTYLIASEETSKTQCENFVTKA